jgi:hypothetical protein
MVTRAERLKAFVTDTEPPIGSLVQVLCEDHVGTYLLPFQCRSTPEGLRNEETSEIIEGHVVGWRHLPPRS